MGLDPWAVPTAINFHAFSVKPTYREGTGEGVGEGVGVGGGFSSALTWSRFRSVTRPRRRYQIPSPVSHTSSALILVPSVSRMLTGPRLFPASIVVATGPVLSATRADSVLTAGFGVGVGLGEGDGDGDGVGVGLTDGEVSKGGGGETTCCVKGWFDADWLVPSAIVSFVSPWYATNRATPTAIVPIATASRSKVFLLESGLFAMRVVPSSSQN